MPAIPNKIRVPKLPKKKADKTTKLSRAASKLGRMSEPVTGEILVRFTKSEDGKKKFKTLATPDEARAYVQKKGDRIFAVSYWKEVKL